MVYRLSCDDCSFEQTVDKSEDLDEVYNRIESHQNDHQEDPVDHFVNFEATHASRLGDR